MPDDNQVHALAEEAVGPDLRRLSIPDLAAACGTAYGMVDKCIRAVLELARAAGYTIPCRRGCCLCCDCMIPATLAEAAPIALWLSGPERKPCLERFRVQTARIREALGPELAEIEEAIRAPDVLAAEERYLAAAQRYRRLKFACPFLATDGSCVIYAVRPLLCRTHYVLGTSDFCSRYGPAEAAKFLSHPILIEAVDLARGIVAGASAEAGSAARRLLPLAVEAVLVL